MTRAPWIRSEQRLEPRTLAGAARTHSGHLNGATMVFATPPIIWALEDTR